MVGATVYCLFSSAGRVAVCSCGHVLNTLWGKNCCPLLWGGLWTKL